MTERPGKQRFASRPGDPDSWIKVAETPVIRPEAGATNTARLTIDVTPDMRGRIKITAFQRGVTVADMLRDVLAREFPPTDGDPS